MHQRNVRQKFNKYASKLLFQFRFDNEGKGGFRTIEERICLIEAESAERAYEKFLNKGKSLRRVFKNSEGERCTFEFIGIMDMMHLGIECEPGEVWYEFRKMKFPMERKGNLLPRKEALSAIRYEHEKLR
jgi:hypothetical protein